MNDDILPYYSQELSYIKNAAAQFAKTYPIIAGRLHLGIDKVEDPHVARLIEAFAFIAARTHKKIDDDFPELTSALLNILYPHYQLPMPSLAIIQFTPKAVMPAIIPARTQLETIAINDVTIKYRTVYPVTLLPLYIKSASLSGYPLTAPQIALPAQAALHIILSSLSDDIGISAILPTTIRFFLKGQEAQRLYELIHNQVIGIAAAVSATDSNPSFLDISNIKVVGFAADEGLLDYDERSFIGYRLLSEYFAFAQKFLFFDLDLPALHGFDRELNLFFYLKHSQPLLERIITLHNFALNAAPIINLFKQIAEPIEFDHRQTSYQIIPDARAIDAVEVYKIEAVYSKSNNEIKTFDPFYAIKHSGGKMRYWQATNYPANIVHNGQNYSASDIFLSLVDSDFSRQSSTSEVLTVETLCFNRIALHKAATIKMTNPLPAVIDLQFIVLPTAVLRPPVSTSWRLISHLALNHISLASRADNSEVLREILTLYDFCTSPATKMLIQSITSLTAKKAVARIDDGLMTTFCRGFDFTIGFADNQDAGIYLIASIIERFLGLYCTINSFTRLNIAGREEILWPARAGNKIII